MPSQPIAAQATATTTTSQEKVTGCMLTIPLHA
jgi:hypothetical protein